MCQFDGDPFKNEGAMPKLILLHGKYWIFVKLSEFQERHNISEEIEIRHDPHINLRVICP